jgi:hypothetical protein
MAILGSDVKRCSSTLCGLVNMSTSGKKPRYGLCMTIVSSYV